MNGPLSLLAELTHRCPLRCPYCSNPVALERREGELDTAEWRDVLGQAAALGVLHVHFSGGEPMARPDLPELVRHASGLGLYTNLITSGVLMDGMRLAALAEAGLDHVQLSFQDVAPAEADRIGGYRGGHAAKLRAAALIRAADLPLTFNFVVHRQNCARIGAMIDFAAGEGANRVEIAHTQYHGWAERNRDALLPDRVQLEAADRAVAEARVRHGDRLAIDYVTPDYHADEPKPCMGGWGRRFLNVAPDGSALPCHAAQTLPGLRFPSVREQSLAEIWFRSEAFGRFRGVDWMPETCRGCARREIDHGGCRCQALALAGDAAAMDPVCGRSPHRPAVDAILAGRPVTAPDLIYRRH
ncbi:pyrroloquinoline quinone biosynthesis protein PqqE [Acetobacteraceae bacterium KSS8]|uniref:PqqA peptide cyclase n=1 Tax=Endosaccharibacter trunci TaxID=2812733 RepID=A0ABT1W8A3_9PROT|nr:pyrroloquinoline quinone biosynthesis protein PqqE [Acetobacteraceae bacterium KSS8]